MSHEETVKVAGMTCEHCVNAVTEELKALPGVTAVDVDLVKGGDSLVTITSDDPVTGQAISEAIDEAGYEVVD